MLDLHSFIFLIYFNFCFSHLSAIYKVRMIYPISLRYRKPDFGFYWLVLNLYKF